MTEQETRNRLARLEQRVDIIREAQEVRGKNVRECANNIYDRLDRLDKIVAGLLKPPTKGA